MERPCPGYPAGLNHHLDRQIHQQPSITDHCRLAGSDKVVGFRFCVANFQIFRRQAGLQAGLPGSFKILITYHRDPDTWGQTRLCQKGSAEGSGSD